MHTVRELQTFFIDYLSQNSFIRDPQELYDPVNYILGLGGKRLRPVMLLMACNLFKDEVKAALPAAFAVEIFHNFSLLHDDIMDEAPLRRGQPTVHKKYDVNSGILSGDVMLIYAYDYLMKLEDQANIGDLIKLFNQTAIEVCEGQQLDMNFETRDSVQIEEYLRMISLKTAALLAGAMKMGAIIGGASKEDAQCVFDFGWNVGIAFQLQDDILDTYGDPEKFGKKVGGDIVQNKKTYLVLRALELADDATAKELSQLMMTPTVDEIKKIETVRGLFDRLQVRQEAEQLKESYLDRAFAAFDAINVTDFRRQNLASLANDLMGREV